MNRKPLVAGMMIKLVQLKGTELLQKSDFLKVKMNPNGPN